MNTIATSHPPATTAPPRPDRAISDAWARHADDLADWTLRHLVNRDDVYGLYKRWKDRDGNEHRLMTAPARSRRGIDKLTRPIIVRHYADPGDGRIIGLHSTSTDNLCQWFAGDIDRHDDDPESVKPEHNFAAAVAWFNRLRGLGFDPILEDSNGAGGFHLWVILDSPAPAAHVFAFAQSLIADFADHGLAQTPETLPKQADIGDGYGNWLRLFGRHHSRDHYSRIYADGDWIDGEEAIERILSATPAPARLIPAVEVKREPPRLRLATSDSPPSGGKFAVEKYLSKLPTGLRAGEQRSHHAYVFAAFMVRDLRLSDDSALHWLDRWNQLQADPLPREKLRQTVINAHHYGRHAYGGVA